MSYSEEDWQAEHQSLRVQDMAQACPSCQRAGFYGPRKADDGRRYRMCKFCGFYQEVGGEPVQLRPCAHGCDDHPKVLGAYYIQWVQPDETTYRCFYCGSTVSADDTLVEAPVESESHPWRDVPRAGTYGQYRQFWQTFANGPRRYL